MASISLTYSAATHVGLRRADNQDAWGIFPERGSRPAAPGGRLFVVADGMGGHLGGQEASRIAVEALAAAFYDAGDDAAEAPLRLRHAFEAANGRIYERARGEPALFGMGTTCTALVFDDGRAWIAHIGDSRAYRITGDEARLLTDDHTRVGDLVRRNLLTEEEAARHPSRNILNRAMGVQPDVEVDLFEIDPPTPGDAFVLCTDGLAGVSSAEIRSVVLAQPPAEACERLVQMANDRGGHDNVTVMVIRAAGAAEPGPHARPEARRYGWGGLLLLILLLALAFALYT